MDILQTMHELDTHEHTEAEAEIVRASTQDEEETAFVISGNNRNYRSDDGPIIRA